MLGLKYWIRNREHLNDSWTQRMKIQNSGPQLGSDSDVFKQNRPRNVFKCFWNVLPPFKNQISYKIQISSLHDNLELLCTPPLFSQVPTHPFHLPTPFHRPALPTGAQQTCSTVCLPCPVPQQPFKDLQWPWNGSSSLLPATGTLNTGSFSRPSSDLGSSLLPVLLPSPLTTLLKGMHSEPRTMLPRGADPGRGFKESLYITYH